MHRVLEEVDRQLDQTLELAHLARVASFSPFHFHRLFTAWMGETLGEYVRRRRLELGAQRLITQPRLTVLQVALSVGFGSGEAFGRAFKTRFGATPTAWRQTELSKRDQLNSKRDQDAPAARANHGVMKSAREASMKVRVVDRQPTNVAYMRHIGPYGEELLEFWTKKVAPWMATNDLFGHTRYGIIHDDPTITTSEKLRYDAAIEVPPEYTGAGNYQKSVLRGGRYAVFKFQGTNVEIGEAWTSMLRDWLPDSGMQLDSRPFIEHYPIEAAAYDPATGVFGCEICIPVAPL